MPKGLSLHIGINRVSPNHYKQVNHLMACENDAKAMQTIAYSKGFSTRILLSTEATIKKFYTNMNQCISLLEEGDILFVSFSGHGGSIIDWSADEEDGRDETWCFYDRQLVDDELSALLSKIPPGIRVLIISDSCHSGTILKNNSDLFSDSIFTKKKFNTNITRQVNTSVRLLSGCQDNEYSIEKGNHGLFTKVILEVWDKGNFRGNYEDFYQSILKRITYKQRPNHLILGPKNNEYDNEIPFSI